MSTEIRQLPVQLTEDELRQRAHTMADKTQQREQLEDEKKSQAAAASSRLKILDGELSLLASQIRQGTELRAVDCSAEPDYEAGVMVTTRDDIDEEIERRALTLSERQLEMAGTDPAKGTYGPDPDEPAGDGFEGDPADQGETTEDRASRFEGDPVAPEE